MVTVCSFLLAQWRLEGAQNKESKWTHNTQEMATGFGVAYVTQTAHLATQRPRGEVFVVCFRA